jgi:hypothetical protein
LSQGVNTEPGVVLGTVGYMSPGSSGNLCVNG